MFYPFINIIIVCHYSLIILTSCETDFPVKWYKLFLSYDQKETYIFYKPTDTIYYELNKENLEDAIRKINDDYSIIEEYI